MTISDNEILFNLSLLICFCEDANGLKGDSTDVWFVSFITLYCIFICHYFKHSIISKLNFPDMFYALTG